MRCSHLAFFRIPRFLSRARALWVIDCLFVLYFYILLLGAIYAISVQNCGTYFTHSCKMQFLHRVRGGYYFVDACPCGQVMLPSAECSLREWCLAFGTVASITLIYALGWFLVPKLPLPTPFFYPKITFYFFGVFFSPVFCIYCTYFPPEWADFFTQDNAYNANLGVV